MDETYKLCYISDHKAYFTTNELSKQWGDDWNDVPYESNAEAPYAWDDRRDGQKYEIDSCFYDGNLSTPADLAWGGNSRYSVDMINAGAVAWLTTDEWHVGEKVSIMAGATFPEFVELVYRAGGKVYTEIQRETPGDEYHGRP